MAKRRLLFLEHPADIMKNKVEQLQTGLFFTTQMSLVGSDEDGDPLTLLELVPRNMQVSATDQDHKTFPLEDVSHASDIVRVALRVEGFTAILPTPRPDVLQLAFAEHKISHEEFPKLITWEGVMATVKREDVEQAKQVYEAYRPKVIRWIKDHCIQVSFNGHLADLSQFCVYKNGYLHHLVNARDCTMEHAHLLTDVFENPQHVRLCTTLVESP